MGCVAAAKTIALTGPPLPPPFSLFFHWPAAVPPSSQYTVDLSSDGPLCRVAAFLLELTLDLEPMNVAAFSVRIRDIAVGRLKVPGAPEPQQAPARKWKVRSGGGGGGGCCASPTAGRKLAAAAPAPAPAASSTGLVVPLADLQAGLPVGVDAARKEEYLSVEEFEALFGMAKEAFAKLPGWKKKTAKKKASLF